MELSIRRFNLEYLSWSLEWGNNKNKEGITFGQYLDDKYNLPIDIISDLLYEEDINAVYNEILENLQRNGQKTTT